MKPISHFALRYTRTPGPMRVLGSSFILLVPIGQNGYLAFSGQPLPSNHRQSPLMFSILFGRTEGLLAAGELLATMVVVRNIINPLPIWMLEQMVHDGRLAAPPSPIIDPSASVQLPKGVGPRNHALRLLS